MPTTLVHRQTNLKKDVLIMKELRKINQKTEFWNSLHVFLDFKSFPTPLEVLYEVELK